MPSVQIFKLDDGDDNEEVAKLDKGEHVFGRDTFLACNDKRVSRRHGIIKITDEEVTITPIHINPCFYISSASNTVSILTKDKPVPLKDDDRFALLPDQFWFKVKISKDNKTEINHKKSTMSPVINLPSWLKFVPVESEPILKQNNAVVVQQFTRNNNMQRNSLIDTNTPREETKNSKDEEEKSGFSGWSYSDVKTEIVTENEEDIKPSVSELAANNINHEIEENVQNEEENSISGWSFSDVKTEIVTENEEDKPSVSGVCANNTRERVKSDLDEDQTVPVKKEQLSDEDDDTSVKPRVKPAVNADASGSANQQPQKRKWRDRCWYGASCYRKNIEHKKEYSHPGDSDFESDPEDNRPTCSYGAACYRRNSTHRRDYKHPANTNGGPPPKKRQKRKKDNAGTAKTPKKQNIDDEDDLEDDYDLEDPFIDDGSEDEYEPDNLSDESDSEWNDSQAVDDGEDTKRLVKEAKRFTKNAKKD